MALLGVNQNGMVHLMQLLFSVLVGLYSSERKFFYCCRELPRKGIPPVDKMGIDAFGVWRAMHAVMRVDYISHLEGPPPGWQANPYKMAGKLSGGGGGLKLGLIGAGLIYPFRCHPPLGGTHKHFRGEPEPVPAPGRSSDPLRGDA